MKTQLLEIAPAQWQADILLAFGFENEDFSEICPEAAECCPWLANTPGMRDFTGVKKRDRLFYGEAGVNVPRALILGAGARDDFTIPLLRELIAAGLEKCRGLGARSVLVPLSLLENISGGFTHALEEMVYAAHIGLYRFLELKTEKIDEPDPETLFLGPSSKTDAALAARFINRGESAASATALARNLDNLPANLLYPETFALRASALAQEAGIKCEIISENGLESEGMGCMLAVGSGSGRPPRLIVLEHAPEGHEKDAPIMLIGKGLTFDSGGICLKPASNMWQMKCDMSGAAAVLAAMIAAGKEKTQHRIIGLLPCAENMPDGNAFRPGDVLSSADGKTVEVINTDAEGRLVLCDAIAYGLKRWQPAALIDIATLTGACAVALGSQVAGLFATNGKLATRLLDTGQLCGENLWQLPLWEGYVEELKSPIADIRHTASREGGAITAALFLKSFVGSAVPWAHLDIAGVDFNTAKKPLCGEGATGFGARILLEICRGGV